METVLLLPFQFDDFSFSLLICLAWTSSTVLNKSGKCGHPCLVPNHRGKAFSFSPLSMMFAVGLSYMAYIMLRYIPSIPTLLRVFLWWKILYLELVWIQFRWSQFCWQQKFGASQTNAFFASSGHIRVLILAMSVSWSFFTACLTWCFLALKTAINTNMVLSSVFLMAHWVVRGNLIMIW